MPKDDTKDRRRMVVEEVSPVPAEVISNEQPLEEIKRGVEELQDITEHMSEDVKESAEVQEEIVEATEKVEPSFQPPVMPLASVNLESSYPPRHSSGINPLIIIIPGILLLGALLGGIVFYQKGVGEQGLIEITTPTETPAASITPSATPSATIDLQKYTVAIFNGSGIPGEAGKVKDLITTAGFKAGATSNAATYDYTKTIIKAKSTVDSAFTNKLSETLAKNYVVDKVQTLDSTSKNEVEVIVGSSKAN
jgi:hypothetical protein